MVIITGFFMFHALYTMDACTYHIPELDVLAEVSGAPVDDVLAAELGWEEEKIEKLRRTSRVKGYRAGKDDALRAIASVHPAIEIVAVEPAEYAHSAAASEQTLALPVYPELIDEQIRYVVDCVKRFYAGS